jgi:hypothetical protein
VWNGTKSQKVDTNNHGEGVRYSNAPQLSAASDSLEWSVKIMMYLASGTVRVDLGQGASTADLVDREGATIFPPDEDPVYSTAGWHEIVFEGLRQTDGDYLNFFITQEGAGTATFYLDSVSIEPTAGAGAQWWAGDSRYELVKRANVALRDRRQIRESYQVSLLDLTEFDPGMNPYDALATSAVITLEDPGLGIDTALYLKTIERDLLNPIDARVTVDNVRRTVATEQAAQLKTLIRTKRRMFLISGKIERTRVTAPGVSRAYRRNPSTRELTFRTTGQRSGGVGKLRWPFRGFAAHGVPFLSKLVVPAGRKVVWMFWPTDSASVVGSVGTDDGFPYYYGNEAERLVCNPAAFANLANDAAFSVHDGQWNPVRYIKTFLTQVGAADYLSTPASLNRTRANAFHGFVPPGTYTDLMLFAYGEPSDGADAVIYAGNLWLAEEPLFQGRLYSSASAGGTTLEIESYPNTAAGEGLAHVIPWGKLKVGAGVASEETVTVTRQAASGVHPERRTLQTATTLSNNHDAGELVVESQPGS